MAPSAWRSRKRKPLLESGADDLDGDGTMNSGRSPLSSGPTYESATPRYWRTARTDDVAVPLHQGHVHAAGCGVRLAVGQVEGCFGWGHEGKVAAKREGVAWARGRDFTESEARAHSCRVAAAVGEPGEVERGVELCHDAVSDGL